MTLYKSKHQRLKTYATDGKLIQFVGGHFKATRKAERDVLDNIRSVRKVVGATEQRAKPQQKPKSQTKPKTQTQTQAKAKSQPTKAVKPADTK